MRLTTKALGYLRPEQWRRYRVRLRRVEVGRIIAMQLQDQIHAQRLGSRHDVSNPLPILWSLGVSGVVALCNRQPHNDRLPLIAPALQLDFGITTKARQRQPIFMLQPRAIDSLQPRRNSLSTTENLQLIPNHSESRKTRLHTRAHRITRCHDGRSRGRHRVSPSRLVTPTTKQIQRRSEYHSQPACMVHI